MEDGFDHLSGRPGDSMRGRMRIHFINEFGEHEAGVDGGGLFKDFMEGIIKVAFDVQYGLFKVRRRMMIWVFMLLEVPFSVAWMSVSGA